LTGPTAPDRRRILVGAAWLVLGAAAVQLLDGFLGGTPAAAVLGAVLVDLLAGRAGVRWSGHTPAPWAADLRTGALLGGTVGLSLIVIGHTLGWATVVLGVPGISILFALGRVVATAARDAMLYRWLPVALGRRAGVPDHALLVFVLLLAVVPTAARGAAPVVLALAAAEALLGVRLVLATRGAIAATAGQAALALALGPFSRGGALDVTWWKGDPGPAPHAQGAAGWLAVGLVTAAALAVPRLVRSRPDPAPAPPGEPSEPPDASEPPGERERTSGADAPTRR
jgi:hypothetical protein